MSLKLFGLVGFNKSGYFGSSLPTLCSFLAGESIFNCLLAVHPEGEVVFPGLVGQGSDELEYNSLSFLLLVGGSPGLQAINALGVSGVRHSTCSQHRVRPSGLALFGHSGGWVQQVDAEGRRAEVGQLV